MVNHAVDFWKLLSLFKRDAAPAEPSAEQDAFLRQALEEYNAKLEILNQRWRFPEGAGWTYDRKTALFRMVFKDGGVVEAEGQIIGNFTFHGRTWEWAWNNPRLPENITQGARRVRDWGEKDKFEHLTRGKMPAHTQEFATLMAAAAAKVLDSDGVYAGADGSLVLYIALKNLRKVGEKREAQPENLA